MTIDQKIQYIGNEFRSLNRRVEIRGKDLTFTEYRWSVTFVYEGEMVDTQQRGNMDDALYCAIEMVDLARTKKLREGKDTAKELFETFKGFY